MKKDWQSRNVHENAWGLHFKRWYILAPSGNVYKIYRGAYSDTIYLLRDIEDCKKSLKLGTTFNEAIKKVYEFEERTKKCKRFLRFVSDLTEKIKQEKEYQLLYGKDMKKYSYSW